MNLLTKSTLTILISSFLLFFSAMSSANQSEESDACASQQPTSTQQPTNTQQSTNTQQPSNPK